MKKLKKCTMIFQYVHISFKKLKYADASKVYYKIEFNTTSAKPGRYPALQVINEQIKEMHNDFSIYLMNKNFY